MRTDDPNLVYTIETATDLNGIWTVAEYTVVSTTSLGNGCSEITSEIQTDDPNVFIRLTVTER